jgi:hypothetical protein
MATELVHSWTRDELVGVLTRACWERLNMSPAEFLRQYRAGALDDRAASVSDLLALCFLLPEDDPVLAPA